jgi:hypothetical protein
MRSCFVFGAFLFVGACTGGGSSSGYIEAGVEGSSDGSSGGTGGDGGACPAFHPGGTNDPSIGGSATSQVAAQAAADLSGAADVQTSDVTAACKGIATTLGASASDQSAADANSDPLRKEQAWCALAVSAIGTAKATLAATISVTASTSPCRESVATKGACQGRCSGGTCDTAANPMTCTGGSLSGGYCVGGKLEGGCHVDAKCDSSCDTSVAAAADCAAPTVTIAVSGASDPAAAAKLKTALEAGLPAIFANKNKCELEGTVSSTFSVNVSAASDLDVPCIPVVIRTAGHAIDAVTICAKATADVAGTVQ